MLNVGELWRLILSGSRIESRDNNLRCVMVPRWAAKHNTQRDGNRSPWREGGTPVSSSSWTHKVARDVFDSKVSEWDSPRKDTDIVIDMLEDGAKDAW